ncbi:MAG: hypothetical protein CFH01_00558 [Alphaproteobacteria bacterium MarineAlpha2_Bin1]|nr:MAG: hypothetical protein CFH01_00558 [Alphaproteobacteria bacterium MarineAlpha2_Bin1]|tara:strand:- start:348 stop:686 length:339 start_codon:yes stop_codon:yes gene_type:complete
MIKRKKSLRDLNTIKSSKQVCFDKEEINEIMSIYTKYVIAGEWCDYAIHFGKVEAVFAVFGKRSFFPAYKIVKRGNAAKKYRLIDPGGRIILIGEELRQIVNCIGRSYIRAV